MTTLSSARKIKCSFTLSPESVAYLRETRAHRHSESDSEALDLLLKDLQQEARRRDLDAAVTAYYDTATEGELREEREWSEGAGHAITGSEIAGSGIWTGR
ncbi:MAG: hypothetical protein ACLGSH_17955 [Acidobacteriota bacterium]